MSYTIYFENYNVGICKENVYDFVRSIDIKDIRSIFKSYCYKNITDLCLYDYEFKDTDYIGNYTSLSEMYGPDAINNIDIELLHYLQNT
jgi:hypothetical protein